MAFEIVTDYMFRSGEWAMGYVYNHGSFSFCDFGLSKTQSLHSFKRRVESFSNILVWRIWKIVN